MALWLIFSHPSQQIAGVNTYNDPNHPVEIYYGEPVFHDLKSMIENLGVTVYPEDKVATVPEPDLGIGSQITIIRATKVNVTDAKKNYTYHTWQTSITDLLKEKGIELLGQDSVTPAVTSILTYNMNIVITRVAEVEVTETQPITFSIKKQNDNTLEKGNKKVTQKGINGEKSVTYKVKRVDGVEVSKSVINTQITKPAQDEIDVVGTKVVVYGTGEASWYIRTSAMIGACNIVPKGTKLHVVNLANGKSIDITSSGGGIETAGRIVDLSTGAFEALGATLGQGTIGNVRVEKYYP